MAKLLGDKQAQVGHKTIDGAVVGTPFYMSPEQALCHEVSAAADIYAMGVVMYEMVTGTVPFHSEQLVILLNAILKQPAPPPSRIRREIPPWLDRLVLRCLEKDPEARPQSMEEVGAVLAAGATELGGSLAGSDAALGATMMAPAGVTPAPIAAQQVATARTLTPRQQTVNGAAAASPVATAHAHTVPPRQTATGVARQTGIRIGGMAKPAEAPGLVAARAHATSKPSACSDSRCPPSSSPRWSWWPASSSRTARKSRSPSSSPKWRAAPTGPVARHHPPRLGPTGSRGDAHGRRPAARHHPGR